MPLPLPLKVDQFCYFLNFARLTSEDVVAQTVLSDTEFHSVEVPTTFISPQCIAS